MARKKASHYCLPRYKKKKKEKKREKFIQIYSNSVDGRIHPPTAGLAMKFFFFFKLNYLIVVSQEGVCVCVCEKRLKSLFNPIGKRNICKIVSGTIFIIIILSRLKYSAFIVIGLIVMQCFVFFFFFFL